METRDKSSLLSVNEVASTVICVPSNDPHVLPGGTPSVHTVRLPDPLVFDPPEEFQVAYHSAIYRDVKTDVPVLVSCSLTAPIRWGGHQDSRNVHIGPPLKTGTDNILSIDCAGATRWQPIAMGTITEIEVRYTHIDGTPIPYDEDDVFVSVYVVRRVRSNIIPHGISRPLHTTACDAHALAPKRAGTSRGGRPHGRRPPGHQPSGRSLPPPPTRKKRKKKRPVLWPFKESSNPGC